MVKKIYPKIESRTKNKIHFCVHFPHQSWWGFNWVTCDSLQIGSKIVPPFIYVSKPNNYEGRINWNLSAHALYVQYICPICPSTRETDTHYDWWDLGTHTYVGIQAIVLRYICRTRFRIRSNERVLANDIYLKYTRTTTGLQTHVT